jgi:MFS family permease
MSDWTGRKPVLGIADIIFIGGAIAQAVCHDVWSMVRPDPIPSNCRVFTCIGVWLLFRLAVDFLSA